MVDEKGAVLRIKIVSDGSRDGTRIFDATTGADLSHLVKEVTFNHQAGREPIVTAEFFFRKPEVEIEVDTNVYKGVLTELVEDGDTGDGP